MSLAEDLLIWHIPNLTLSPFLAPQSPPDWQEILTYFRGSELQNYFMRVLEDNLKVSAWVKGE